MEIKIDVNIKLDAGTKEFITSLFNTVVSGDEDRLLVPGENNEAVPAKRSRNRRPKAEEPVLPVATTAEPIPKPEEAAPVEADPLSFLGGVPEPQQKSVTLEDIHALAVSIAKQGIAGQDKVRKVLVGVNANDLASLKQEHYTLVYNQLLEAKG